MTEKRMVRTRSIVGILISLVPLHWLVDLPVAAALQQAVVVIDGRVTVAVEVARGHLAQAKGLGGRATLKKGTGMVFPYDGPGRRGIWMKGMLIPIDIVWILGGRIVAIEVDVQPPSSKGALAVFSYMADQVLEVPAGYVHEMGLRIGQSVQVTYK
jgi:uncharacterized membrane protein (UPF0127 family)